MRFLPRRALCASLALAGLVAASGLNPVTAVAAFPAGFTQTTMASPVNPTKLALAPDGRVFVSQQGGALRVVKDGVMLATPFVSLTVGSSGERGLLGVAFDPNFAVNQFVYVYYTATTPTVHNRISRFTAMGDVAQPGSEVVLVDLDNLSSATNHNGGALLFGPDGKLFVSVGDNANGANAQTLTNRLGKILRYNADGSIPTDNPFFNSATGANRAIWALGLRNPFALDFQAGTGRLFINDVGQSTFEEINEGTVGANYGWPTFEGPDGGNASFTDPLLTYGHSGADSGCAITGGAFYDPATTVFPPAFVGAYLYADLCNGQIRRFDPGTGTSAGFASGLSNVVDLQVAADGSLWVLERGSGTGRLSRVTFSTPPPPGPITARSSSTSGSDSSRTKMVINKPAGTVSGDLLLATVTVNDDDAVTAPSGWTLVRSDSIKDKVRLAVFRRFAGGSEPVSYTFSVKNSRRLAGGITAYTGVHPTTPVDGHKATVDTSADTAVKAPSVITTRAGVRLVVLSAINAGGNLTAPAALTERWEAAALKPPSRSVTVSASDEARPAAGATGVHATTAGASGAHIGTAIALRPAS